MKVEIKPSKNRAFLAVVEVTSPDGRQCVVFGVRNSHSLAALKSALETHADCILYARNDHHRKTLASDAKVMQRVKELEARIDKPRKKSPSEMEWEEIPDPLQQTFYRAPGK